MKVLHFILIFGLLVFLQIQLTFAGSIFDGGNAYLLQVIK